MPAAPKPVSGPLRTAENVGRSTVRSIRSFGLGTTLLGQALYWLFLGARHGQAVRPSPIFVEAMQHGVRAIPIISLLAFAIGLTLALQGIHSLGTVGLQDQVVLGVAPTIVREFGPLITGILVAGRSGSALAARLGTMTISNEIDALRVMGINPVRFLVAPSLVAMVVMLPALTLWSNFMGLLGAGVYVTGELGLTLSAYIDQTIQYVDVDDVMHGLTKSAIFAVLVTIVGFVDGSSVEGGAEGVGRVTTASVVHGISAIVLTDMLFVFAATR